MATKTWKGLRRSSMKWQNWLPTRDVKSSRTPDISSGWTSQVFAQNCSWAFSNPLSPANLRLTPEFHSARLGSGWRPQVRQVRLRQCAVTSYGRIAFDSYFGPAGASRIRAFPNNRSCLIAQRLRLQKSLGSAQLPGANLAAALEAADQARIAALDALLIHRTKQV